MDEQIKEINQLLDEFQETWISEKPTIIVDDKYMRYLDQLIRETW
jgi:hypothetical protein